MKKDIKGEKFGNLVAIRLDEEKNNKQKLENKKNIQTYWICQCLKCKEIKSVSIGCLKQIKDRNTEGCHCGKGNNFVDLTGKTFGNLIVKEPDLKRWGNKRTYWLCDCKCGTKNFSMETYRLKNAKCPNCGCLSDKMRQETKLKKQNEKYKNMGSYFIGLTTNTNKEFYFDKDDYERVSRHLWCEDGGDT